MIGLQKYKDNLFRVVRFYDVSFHALSQRDTRAYVLKKMMAPLKPKTAEEMASLLKSKAAGAIVNVKGSFYFLASSVNAIAIAYFEVFVDDLMAAIFEKEPGLLQKFHKKKPFQQALKDEMIYFHRKDYYYKMKYFKQVFGLDWSKHKKAMTRVNKLRNDFLHRGKVYAFTPKHIFAQIMLLLKIGEELSAKAGEKYSIKIG